MEADACSDTGVSNKTQDLMELSGFYLTGLYNRLYDYFSANSILFHKQFGFWAGHSTEHALLELIDQICDSFNDKNYFLGIFIDLSKAFDTVDHSILLQKLEHYGIKGRSLSWFQSYLSIHKQCIEFKQDNKTGNTELSNICEVPQRFNSWTIAFHNLC